MSKKKLNICIISIYFGKLPEWIDVWFKTASYNDEIDFLFVTDQNITTKYNNIKILNMSFLEFKSLAIKKLDFNIKLETPYKLCDYKEVWGLILEDELKKYDYWGECDTDVVFGNLQLYFKKYQLYKYDKFGCRGHLTLYKNNNEVINRYKLSGGWFGSYKEVFKSNMIWAFDETPGINAIYQKHGFPYMDDILFGDVDVNYNDIRLVDFACNCPPNYMQQIFYWSNGSLLRKFVKDGKIMCDELMYIHLQKRKMLKPDFDVDCSKEFIITNGKFINKDFEIKLSDFEKYNNRNDNLRLKKKFGGKYKKDLRFYWLGRRLLNLKYETKQKIKKSFIYKLLKKGK